MELSEGKHLNYHHGISLWDRCKLHVELWDFAEPCTRENCRLIDWPDVLYLLKFCLSASVSLRQPSPTEAGPWSIWSLAALRFLLAFSPLDSKQASAYLSVTSSLPRKFGVNSFINHLLLKTIYRAGSAVVSRPDCTPGSHSGAR